MKESNESFWKFLNKFEKIGFIIIFINIIIFSVYIVNIFVKFMPRHTAELCVTILMVLVAIEGGFFCIGRKKGKA